MRRQPMQMVLALVLAGLTAATCPAQGQIAAGQARAVAEEAFVFGLPLVMNYGTLYQYAVDTSSPEFKAPFNRIHNTARVFTPKDTAIVTPNSDTPYSMLWMDLRAEPLVVTVPEIEKGRYFSVQLVDLYTFNYGYIGSRTTGNGGGAYLIAGPSWRGEPPAGIAGVYRCETDFSLAIFRTQLFGAGDLDNVKKIQAGYSAVGLSAFLGRPAPPAPPEVRWPRFDKATADADPFAYLNLMLRFCPATGPAAAEEPLRARFAAIGIGPGQPSPLAGADEARRAELAAGIQDGLARVRQGAERLGRVVNGWRMGSAFGDRAFYRGDWTLRAAAAAAGIYGNDASEALYLLLAADGAGNKPDCAEGRYTLTFPAGQLPPANAFWSVTMYDARTQLLVDNPLDRYLINAPMLPGLKRADDGSLTLYIQAESPGAERESNWLPAPRGPIFVVMRLYWPKAEALDGRWKPPAIQPAH